MLGKGNVPGGQVPGHALGAAAVVDVAADGEARTDTPELPAERFAARSAALVGLVAVGAGGCVGDDDVRVQGDVVPERGQVRGGRRRGERRVVVEGPEAVARGVRGAEDLELGLGPVRGGEADGGRGVVEVGDAGRGGEQGEAVIWRLGFLVVKGVAVFCVEVLV